MSTSGRYQEHIGGCSVHQGHIMMHVEEQVDEGLSISIENPDVLMISSHVLLMISPQCTEHLPTYS